MDKENSGMWMETFMKATERMIKPTGKGSITIITGLNMKEAGRMIYRMALVSKHGMMAPDTKGSIAWEKRMARALICGMMAPNIQELGGIIKLVEM